MLSIIYTFDFTLYEVFSIKLDEIWSDFGKYVHMLSRNIELLSYETHQSLSTTVFINHYLLDV